MRQNDETISPETIERLRRTRAPQLERICRALAEGATLETAVHREQLTLEALNRWLADDAEFRERVERIQNPPPPPEPPREAAAPPPHERFKNWIGPWVFGPAPEPPARGEEENRVTGTAAIPASPSPPKKKPSLFRRAPRKKPYLQPAGWSIKFFDEPEPRHTNMNDYDPLTWRGWDIEW
jgi:hypothetical protein